VSFLFSSQEAQFLPEIQELIHPFKLTCGSHPLGEGFMIVYSVTNSETFDHVEPIIDVILQMKKSDDVRIDETLSFPSRTQSHPLSFFSS
jgi:hypothetical protein